MASFYQFPQYTGGSSADAYRPVNQQQNHTPEVGSPSGSAVEKQSTSGSPFQQMVPAWEDQNSLRDSRYPPHQKSSAATNEVMFPSAHLEQTEPGRPPVNPYFESPFDEKVFALTEEHVQHKRPSLPMSHSKRSAARKSLLSAADFGFDVRDSDPRELNPEKTPAGVHASMRSPSSPGKEHLQHEDEANIELITIPGLGAEYDENEIKEMRKKGRKSKGSNAPRKRLAFLMKGDTKLWGCISPRKAVFFAFAMCIILGILLYFVIPRMPTFQVQTTKPLEAVPNGDSMQTHHIPTNFSMDMNINLRADNTGAWVSTVIKDMVMDVTDITTSKRVGSGTIKKITIPARKKTVFAFPVHFAYSSINATGDQTWSHYINACGPTCESRFPKDPF